MDAYILINAAPRILWQVVEEALKIQGVKMAHAVTGQFDVIIYTEFASMQELREIISAVQLIDGVNRTHTCIAMISRLREDYQKM